MDTALGNVNGQLALGNSTTTGTLDTSASSAPITTARNIQIGNFGGTIEMGTNSWSLGGNIYGGPLTVTNPGNLGVAGTSGELILTNAGNSFNALTVNDNGIVQAATNGDLGNGIITLGDATHPGTLDFSTATGTVTESNAIVLNPGGGIFYTNQNTNFWTLSGVISNGSTAAGLTLNGGGTLALTGINTYSGGTTINGGSTLEISADLNLGAVPVAGTPNVVNLNNGGTLALYGYAASQRTITVGTTIGGGGAIDTTGGGTWTFTTPVAGTTLSGPGALTIGGTGTLILDTVGNTLPGGTIVSAGTLEIGDSNTPAATLISQVTHLRRHADGLRHRHRQCQHHQRHADGLRQHRRQCHQHRRHRGHRQLAAARAADHHRQLHGGVAAPPRSASRPRARRNSWSTVTSISPAARWCSTSPAISSRKPSN